MSKSLGIVSALNSSNSESTEPTRHHDDPSNLRCSNASVPEVDCTEMTQEQMLQKIQDALRENGVELTLPQIMQALQQSLSIPVRT